MARDARRAAMSNDDAVLSAAIAEVEKHWHSVMDHHFRCEERLVKMAEDALDPDLVTRFLSEHAELRALADDSCGLSPATRLHRFGELASAHVRYEERVFFPHLQSHPSVVFADEEGNA
jgi:hypothetical protein